MKLTLLFLIIPALSFSQQKINFNIGGTFAANSHDGGQGGITAAIGYKASKVFAPGISADGFVFGNTKYEVVKADLIIYPQYKEKGGSLFIAASPGYTIYSNGNTKGDFAIDGMIGGKALFGGFAVYAGVGYGLASFKTGKQVTKDEGFKLRLAFGI